MPSVLLIEDNLEINETTCEMLEMAGYRTIMANCGKEGVALAIQNQPDIILCDIRMREEDGYEVLAKLKRHERTSTVPFIFFSARTDARDIKKGMALGASGYICKPFSEKELLDTVKRSL